MTAGVTIGAVCMHCCHHKERNLRKYERIIHDAGARGVQLLVFPEVSLQGYLRRVGEDDSTSIAEQLRYYRETSEALDGPTIQLIHHLARQYNMHIQVGMAEREENSEAIYNSAVLVGPRGVVGRFRKVHNPFEWPVFSAGERFEVFETPFGAVGPLICYDLCYPEAIRTLALKGALVATVTTAWPMERDEHDDDYFGYTYDILSRAGAMANQIWFVQSNQVMRPPSVGSEHYWGHSRIIAPTGRVVADIGYAEGIAVATVELLGEVERVRTESYFGGLNLLADRRPETYLDR